MSTIIISKRKTCSDLDVVYYLKNENASDSLKSIENLLCLFVVKMIGVFNIFTIRMMWFTIKTIFFLACTSPLSCRKGFWIPQKVEPIYTFPLISKLIYWTVDNWSLKYHCCKCWTIFLIEATCQTYSREKTHMHRDGNRACELWSEVIKNILESKLFTLIPKNKLMLCKHIYK